MNILNKSKMSLAIKQTLIDIYKQPYKLKCNYKSIIPFKIFQTWNTKDLPKGMKECVESLKKDNPRFEHFLFDDNDCREFIKNNFDTSVLNAYDILIPGAYKADLWRLCVLYIHGGIYMDIKLKCINGFKLIELTEHNHFVKDRIPPLSIYNALMISQKGNPFLWTAICRIVINVNNRFYGKSPLDPTGPVMLGTIILKHQIPANIDLFHYEDGGYIIYKNRFVISTNYNDYNKERTEMNNKKNITRYNVLWHEKNIYK
jgi:mannosyltransferase OCH1-like enzyme